MGSYWRKFDFTPGQVYSLGKTAKYYRFELSELVMESFVCYTFILCDENCRVAFHEDKDQILKDLQVAPEAAQVLYGRTHEEQIQARRNSPKRL